MLKSYKFTMSGTAAGGQTWTVEGTVRCEFADVLNNASLYVFNQLTHGLAVFGKPGIGCRGPYDMDRVLIEQVKQ